MALRHISQNVRTLFARKLYVQPITREDGKVYKTKRFVVYTSFGESGLQKLTFQFWHKGGLTYKFNGRHSLFKRCLFNQQLSEVFIRNNQLVNNIQNGTSQHKISTVSILRDLSSH